MIIYDLPFLEQAYSSKELLGGEVTFNKTDRIYIAPEQKIDLHKTLPFSGFEPSLLGLACTDTVVFYKGEMYPDSCSLPAEARNLPPDHPDFYGPPIQAISLKLL